MGKFPFLEDERRIFAAARGSGRCKAFFADLRNVRDFQYVEHAKAGGVHQRVNLVQVSKREGDALGVGHVQEQHLRAVGLGQFIGRGAAHRGDDLPPLIEKLRDDGLTETGGTTGNEDAGISDLPVFSDREIDNGDRSFYIHLSTIIHQSSKSMLDSVSDPLSSVVTLLKPTVSISKMVEAGGPWLVERRDMASPFYCAMVEGRSQLKVTGRDPVTLTAGDFVLIPHLQGFTMSSEVPPPLHTPHLPLETGPGRFRLGSSDASVDVRALVGHCRFDAPASDLLVSLLPEMIHVSGHSRLTALVPVIHEETRADRPGREMILERLLEVLLIEALRSGPATALPPGLLRGLSDPQLASALRRIHAEAGGALSVSDLAKEAGMSRSTFFERFRKEVGRAPLEYVTDWRMAVAKTLLRQGRLNNTEIALRVGYGSASAFGLAFVRHEGLSPGAFASKHGR
ncbi:AraC family transcriptional regulator [Celeribacter baekdonensis]|uniref:AraC family transcriptional regulator n=2 Tax=Roseobacteraceae TaxID=2854170 RepID=UPI0026ED6642|nr:AraC family transcriptional regulator [Celeribacter baekdonensis]